MQKAGGESFRPFAFGRAGSTRTWSGLRLARAERRTRRNRARAEMMARREGRADRAEGFAAARALFRADKLSPDPATPCFTICIDTLQSRARHKGHKVHPPAASRPRGCELPRRGPKFSGQTNEKIVWRRAYGVNGKAPQAVVVVLQNCGKRAPENHVK